MGLARGDAMTRPGRRASASKPRLTSAGVVVEVCEVRLGARTDAGRSEIGGSFEEAPRLREVLLILRRPTKRECERCVEILPSAQLGLLEHHEIRFASTDRALDLGRTSVHLGIQHGRRS